MKFITTDNYLLMVDETTSATTDEYGLLPERGNNIPASIIKVNNGFIRGLYKILAHLPLNGAPKLEGVDMLPPLEKNMEVKNAPIVWFKHPERTCQFILRVHTADMKPTPHFKIHDGWTHHTVPENEVRFISQDRKYSEEDMRNLWNYMDERAINFLDESAPQIGKFEDYLNSLNTSKLPIGFEVTGEPEEINGKIVWKGRYIW